jgi:hypothetical protein
MTYVCYAEIPAQSDFAGDPFVYSAEPATFDSLLNAG